MARWTRGLRELYQVQVRLWDSYGRRHELSGLRTPAGTAAPAPLRWAGDRLTGTVLPAPTDRPGD